MNSFCCEITLTDETVLKSETKQFDHNRAEKTCLIPFNLEKNKKCKSVEDIVSISILLNGVSQIATLFLRDVQFQTTTTDAGRNQYIYRSDKRDVGCTILTSQKGYVTNITVEVDYIFIAMLCRTLKGKIK